MMNAFVENVRKKIKVPPSSNGEKKKRKSKKKVEKVDDSGPGAVYIGHIPHGFFEKEMRQYFSQFGKVLRLRIARSRRTGRCKGFAFVEFQSSEVAKIVAETMNNYLFFEKLLKCEYIPPEKLHPNTFHGWKFRKYTSRVMNKIKLNKPKDPEIVAKNNKKRVKRIKKLKESLNGIGIKFNIKPFVVKEAKLE